MTARFSGGRPASLAAVVLCVAAVAALAGAGYGAEWRTYNLSSRRVQEVITAMASGKESLWIGYANGKMDRYEVPSDRWTHYDLPEGFGQYKINDMKIIDRYLYLATDTGMCVFDLFTENFSQRPGQANWKGYPLLDIEWTDRYLFLALAHDNPFGVDTPGGLIRYDRGFHTWTLYTAEDGLGSNGLNDIEIEGGVVWLATDLGLTKFEPDVERFTRASYEKGFRDEDIRRIKFVGGRLWCGAPGRIWEFQPETGEAVRIKLGGEYDYAVTKIFPLASFTLVGTEERGLVGYDNRREAFFEIESTDISPTVSAVEFHQGAVWIASRMGRVRDSLVSIPVEPDTDGWMSTRERISKRDLTETPFEERLAAKKENRDALMVMDNAVAALAEGDVERIRDIFTDDFPDLVKLIALFKGARADPLKNGVVTKMEPEAVSVKPMSGVRVVSAPDGRKLFKIVFRRKTNVTSAVGGTEEWTIEPKLVELRGDKIVRWE
ncbi:MAG: hypothetical protein A3G34_08500 [Candidatus Lindowbacteria bacterium RIFCSPLOWO2_12_FULL_62_27]|nr:MAG: hypothetical protein A3G34_08500 [Candidatus Lindowbacteria bacterium RIFCSPLOWO2_12_FULL_62_27]OGH62939.1 MAG: hypothetical protein A3I06_13745 [Candidatus Lindowbacteria bacterium RIFCSPLOWO2_02_FULL_62_12]